MFRVAEGWWLFAASSSCPETSATSSETRLSFSIRDPRLSLAETDLASDGHKACELKSRLQASHAQLDTINAQNNPTPSPLLSIWIDRKQSGSGKVKQSGPDVCNWLSAKKRREYTRPGRFLLCLIAKAQPKLPIVRVGGPNAQRTRANTGLPFFLDFGSLFGKSGTALEDCR